MITDPNGNTVEVTTDAEGHVSPIALDENNEKEFKIKEKL